MKTATHGNGNGLDDLYILPDDHAEAERITQYLFSRGMPHHWSASDVEGQDWYGRRFIEIPFGEGMESVIRAAVETRRTLTPLDTPSMMLPGNR